MNKDLEVLKEIKRRKITYLGYIIRTSKYKILHLIIHGKFVGKRSIGRKILSWLGNLREWFIMSAADLFSAAVSKDCHDASKLPIMEKLHEEAEKHQRR